MTEDDAQRFEVMRSDLRRTRLAGDPDAPAARALAEGEARLRIDRFALTSNNVTYAAFGDAMRYWDFFPTGDPAWGCIPVWGFADVVESRAEGVSSGERLYGYWPMGRYLVVQPARAGQQGFVDATAHRAGLAAVYNRIERCAADPAYDAAQEAQQALLRPLFITSFLIDDFLDEAGFFGAAQVLLSSASSKTAFGTAFCLALRRGRAGAPRVVGLTSAGNLGFCRSLGCYDEVLTYDALGGMDRTAPSVYVDFAGNATLRRAVHEHFGDALRHSASVGGTHWDALGGARDLPGPRPTLFFAPAQIARRSAPPPEGWGAGELQRRIAAAWAAFMKPVSDPQSPWIRVRSGRGAAAVRQAYMALLDGQVDARDGLMLSM
ncbi:MAG: DUF2855 family protein [Rubrivivax sp.]|jgi:hypothetical protein|nr:DUF2855 family protein [Rubrivivax sp.]